MRKLSILNSAENIVTLPDIFERPRKRTERITGLAAVVAVIVIWVAGAFIGESDSLPYLRKAMPAADRFERDADGHYTAFHDQTVIGYLYIGKANGYGGSMKIATAVDIKGRIVGAVIIDQKETPSFLKKVLANRLFETLTGKSVSDPIIMGQDVDGITGATYSSRAVISAVSESAHRIGKEKFNLKVPDPPPPEIKFGLPEITLLLLFIVWFKGREKKFKYTKQARWFSLLTGLVVLGFICNTPLSLTKITGLLLGYVPSWQRNIYWLLLIGGILLFLILNKKNPYCQWFCPFGAAQECLGFIGGAKVKPPNRYRHFLKWTQRGLAFLAIALAILFRSPGVAGYEIFSSFFSMTGSAFQMILLVIILIASLFLKRPWCKYFCPIPPVMDLIKMFRKWIGEI